MIRVNGELIDAQLFEASFEKFKMEAEARTQSSCTEEEEEALMEQAEEEVINSVLIAQEAESSNDSFSEEIVDEATEALIVVYREGGVPPEILAEQKENLRSEAVANLRIQKLINERVAPITEPSERELSVYYESRQEDYRIAPAVRCLHLVKFYKEGQAQRTLLEEVTSLRERMIGGEDFESLALVETDKGSKEVVLDWISLDQPANPFEATLFSMRVGEVSPVLSYEHAFHLVKVVERKESEVPVLADVKEGLLEDYMQEKRQALIQAFARELRAKAEIEPVTSPREE